jgi:hypothetical protein
MAEAPATLQSIPGVVEGFDSAGLAEEVAGSLRVEAVLLQKILWSLQRELVLVHDQVKEALLAAAARSSRNVSRRTHQD